MDANNSVIRSISWCLVKAQLSASLLYLRLIHVLTRKPRTTVIFTLLTSWICSPISTSPDLCLQRRLSPARQSIFCDTALIHLCQDHLLTTAKALCCDRYRRTYKPAQGDTETLPSCWNRWDVLIRWCKVMQVKHRHHFGELAVVIQKQKSWKG